MSEARFAEHVGGDVFAIEIPLIVGVQRFEQGVDGFAAGQFIQQRAAEFQELVAQGHCRAHIPNKINHSTTLNSNSTHFTVGSLICPPLNGSPLRASRSPVLRSRSFARCR